MKKRTIVLIAAQIVLLFLCTSVLYAWTGDTWGTESRETIIRIAREMVDFEWGPMQTIRNWNYGSTWYTFTRGTGPYRGEAYCQQNPQENWAEFTNYVYWTTGGDTWYGNDCSGFVSISWKLPTRYDTAAFESDAKNGGGYVTSLGAVGSSKNVSMIRGDALVNIVPNQEHIILFEYYLPDGSGIKVMEQTPSWARHSNKTWSQLSSYRPIRRNNLTEDNLVFTTKWGSQGNLNGQFNYPWGIAVDSSGNVYVVDSYNNRIQKFNNNGGFITKWGTQGYGNGQFRDPIDVTIDSSGNVYVTDCSNNRMQKFNSNGGFITTWGSYGSGNGQFLCPSGVTVASSGNVYVSEINNSRIQKFNSNGNFITKWGSYGTGAGQFNVPWGVAVDSSENVYVADSYNNRIQKFTSSGGYITKWGACCSPDGYFNVPYGVATDSAGNVFVADTYNHRIQKFNSNGLFLTKWGSNGYMEDGKFQYPEGIAVDSSGNVFVADTDNHRIQKFSLVSPQPSAPTNLAANRASTTSIKLTWKDNSNNETGFKIIRKTTYMGLYSTIATVGPNVTSYTDTGLTYAMQYDYAVSAYNSNGDSAYSNEAGGGTY